LRRSRYGMPVRPGFSLFSGTEDHPPRRGTADRTGEAGRATQVVKVMGEETKKLEKVLSA